MAISLHDNVTEPASPTPPPLNDVLTLEQIDPLLYLGKSYTSSPRIYGGQAVGQALLAAGRTVPDDRRPHSLHGHFLHPGNTNAPVVYQVDKVRDGGSFNTRNVKATQEGLVIFQLTASFQRRENGLSHQSLEAHAPEPESIPDFEDSLPPGDQLTAAPWLRTLQQNIAVDFRFPEEYPRVANARGEVRPARQRAWVRTSEKLSDESLVQAAAWAYTSDLFLLSSALPPHGITIDEPGLQLASLDHSVWLHQDFRADEWHLYEQEGIWMGGGRGLARGNLYTRDGILVASTMQEGLLRLRKPGVSR